VSALRASKTSCNARFAPLFTPVFLLFLSLTRSSFAEDTEHTKLQHLPSINEHVDTLRNSIDQLSETFKLAGMALQESKDKEVGKFEEALKMMRQVDAGTSVKLIEDFSREKKRVFRDIGLEIVSPQAAIPLTAKMDGLYEDLMDLEMQQVQKFEEMLGDFEEAYGELKTQCGDLCTNYFKSLQVRTSEPPRPFVRTGTCVAFVGHLLTLVSLAGGGGELLQQRHGVGERAA